MSEKLSEHSEMSDAAQASELVRDVVPVNGGATIRARILATARRLGWNYSRTRDVWYEQARRIDAHEMDQLRAALKKKEAQEANDDIQQLRARLARLETVLAVADADFHGPHIEAVRGQMRGLGGVADSAGDE